MALSFTTLFSSPRLRVEDVVCDAGPHDAPFEERHGWHGIAFVRSGSFQYRVGKRPATLVPGALMLGKKGTAFVCSHEHSTGDRCLGFMFSEEAFLDVAREAGVRRPEFRSDALPPSRATLRRVLPVAAGAAASSAEESAYLLAAETLSAVHDLTPAPITHTERRRAIEVATLIGERTAEPLSLETLAAHAGTSPFHFLRSFKRAIGVTPHQYLLHRRLERAALALLDGARPVTEIAYAAGFSDLANFNRTFRAAFGCAPRQLRRNFRKVPSLAAP